MSGTELHLYQVDEPFVLQIVSMQTLEAEAEVLLGRPLHQDSDFDNLLDSVEIVGELDKHLRLATELTSSFGILYSFTLISVLSPGTFQLKPPFS